MVPNCFHYLPKQVEDRQFLDRLSADYVRPGEVDASDARAQQRGAQLVEEFECCHVSVDRVTIDHFVAVEWDQQTCLRHIRVKPKPDQNHDDSRTENRWCFQLKRLRQSKTYLYDSALERFHFRQVRLELRLVDLVNTSGSRVADCLLPGLDLPVLLCSRLEI